MEAGDTWYGWMLGLPLGSGRGNMGTFPAARVSESWKTLGFTPGLRVQWIVIEVLVTSVTVPQ
jgi:hypothetical protein